MGSLSLSKLPELVRQSLESYETYFLQNELGWNFSFVPLLVIAAWVSGVVLLATLLLRRQVGVLRGSWRLCWSCSIRWREASSISWWQALLCTIS